jgi:hypothetical protein
MQSNWAAENLQVIRTLMERSALYRRALAPIMLIVGSIGSLAGFFAFYLKSDSLYRKQGWTAFILFWLITGLFALIASFLSVRRQALKESEPFWSPPTRRVTFALAPPLVVGLFLGIGKLIALNSNTFLIEPYLLPGLWMIFYGCALCSAGFFMARGIRLLGLIFLICGMIYLSINWIDLDFPKLLQCHICMAATFGGLHLAYGIYLYFTEKKSVA